MHSAAVRTMEQTKRATRVCLALLVYTCVGCLAAWPTADECGNGLVLTTCGLGDPANFIECIRQELQKAITVTLKNGNSNLRLQAIDPLLVKEMVVTLPMEQTVRLTNLFVTGLSSLTLDGYNLTIPSGDEVTGAVMFSFFIPSFEIRSSYVIQGQWSGCEREGAAFIRISDYSTSFELDMLLQTEGDGEQYLTFTRSRSKFVNAGSTEVVLTDICGDIMKLDFRSNDVRAAFEETIAKKQAVLNLAYILEVYQYAPPLRIFFNPNRTGPENVCLYPRYRDSVSGVDLISLPL